MGRIWFGAAGLLLLTVIGSAAEARPLEVEQQPVSQQILGSAAIIDRAGFVLYQHGVWATSTRSPADQPMNVVQSPRSPPIQATRKQTFDPNGWRRTIYRSQVLDAEARFGLPTGLLDALVWTESRYNPFAVSSAGAVGLGQLMPGTARALGITNRYDPSTNILGAARYLRQMLDRFGVVHLAVAAYNAGPGAIERARGIPINGETPVYVRDVLRSRRP